MLVLSCEVFRLCIPHLAVVFNVFYLTINYRGLDNAGKTTIVKKFSGEDIYTISPTLGFNIQTLEHKG